MQPPSQADSAGAAATFRLDVKAGEVRRALGRAGVSTVLLKGPAFAALFYEQPRARRYSDVDLLIKPGDGPAAYDVLRRLGFRRFDAEGPSIQTDPATAGLIEATGALHGVAWLRDADGLAVDLHHSLPQVSAEPEAVWAAVSAHVTTIDVAGAPTDVLDPAASALLAALHAAHHGPHWGGALEDLTRAVEVLGQETWRDAARVAADLQAETAMGVGLGLTTSGRRVAEALDLPTTPSLALEMLWSGEPWSAAFLAALPAQPGLRARARLLARVLWPSAAAMRRGSALARRGRRGLVAAYAFRSLQLLRRLPRALRGQVGRRRSG